MKKFIPHWYDQESEKAVDSIIVADTVEEATKAAWEKHDGNPPAPILWLEEVE